MSREDVIRHIVERDLHNQGLSAEVVLQEAQDLHAAACLHFGTWDTALHYAGISIRRVMSEEEFKADRVLKRIRTMCCDGYDMSAQHNIRRDRRFYEAARQHFGTWRNALRAAGVNLEHVRLPKKPRTLDKEKIIRQLRQRHEAGLSMKRNDVCLENRALATAAINAFHSWRRALAAAGLASSEHLTAGGKRWSKQRVIEAIHARIREGKQINYSATRRDDSALVSAARRYFGNWSKALLAAGVDVER